MPDQPTVKTNSDRLDTLEAAERVGTAVLSKTATWAVSVAVLIMSVVLSLGALLYFTGDKLLAFQAASMEIAHMKANHEHCQMEVAELKARVSVLEAQKTAGN